VAVFQLIRFPPNFTTQWIGNSWTENIATSTTVWWYSSWSDFLDISLLLWTGFY
jgi:hypothetical protein